MADDEYLLIRIKKRLAYFVSWVFRTAAADLHDKARTSSDPVTAQMHREDGDELTKTANEIERDLRK